MNPNSLPSGSGEANDVRGGESRERTRHEWDDDAVCIHCGFDGAEWYHWKHSTYEGRASDQKQPLCNRMG